MPLQSKSSASFKSFVRTAPALAISAFILLIPALLNGFPFVFPDSGDYLVFTPRIYRSPYYGLFIFLFHMNRWIWMPVIVQSLIVSHLIYMLAKLSGIQKAAQKTILISMVLLLSSAPFFIGFIMADIFTPIMIIGLFLLCFHFYRLKKLEQAYLLILVTIAIAAHVSNLTLALFLLPLLLALLYLCCRSWPPVMKRLGLLSIPLGLAATAILIFNITIFKTVALAPAGSDFLMANMIQYGPAKTYLETTCPQAGYKICPYLNRLPKTADQFLWFSGIFDELGGFTAMKDESRAIVSGTIKAYPGAVARMVFDNFLAGLNRHQPAAEFHAEYQPSSIKDLLQKKFGPRTAYAYASSAEMRNAIPHGLIRTADDFFVPLMLLSLMALCIRELRHGSCQSAALGIFIIGGIIADTVLCTAVSGVHDRYQARVTWLLPLAVIITVISIWDRKRFLRSAG